MKILFQLKNLMLNYLLGITIVSNPQVADCKQYDSGSYVGFDMCCEM